MKVMTNVYFKGKEYLGSIINEPGIYMKNLHILEKNGYFKYIDYCGAMMANVTGKIGNYFSYTIIADRETTKKIFELIEGDYYSESFVLETMERLDAKLRTFSEVIEEIRK